MKIYEPLPDSVKVDGKTYRINTDFRVWLKLLDDVENNKINYNEIFPIKRPRTEEAEKVIIAFLGGYIEEKQGRKQKSASRREKKVISFSVDAPFIVSAFQQCYAIDLLDPKTVLHWWRFRMLLDGLPAETEIKRRIIYRSMDTASIKNKAERDRVRKIQNDIALPQEELSDYEIGAVF